MIYDKTISVLIPTYNRSKTIKDSVLSILSQTYHNINVIIYDDGSSDATSEIIKNINDNRIRYITSTENLGVQIARNELLNLAKTEYACWHDSDDISNIHRIEHQIKFMIDGGFVLSGTNYIGFTDIITKKHDIKVVSVAEMDRLKSLVPNQEVAESIKLPLGGFASTMFQVGKAVAFNVAHSFGGGDSVWLKSMYKMHNVDRPLVPEVLYYVNYHDDRIGVWKKKQEANPDWLNRMREISKR